MKGESVFTVWYHLHIPYYWMTLQRVNKLLKVTASERTIIKENENILWTLPCVNKALWETTVYGWLW